MASKSTKRTYIIQAHPGFVLMFGNDQSPIIAWNVTTEEDENELLSKHVEPIVAEDVGKTGAWTGILHPNRLVVVLRDGTRVSYDEYARAVLNAITRGSAIEFKAA